MSVPYLCRTFIRSFFYLLCILVPLILTPWNYELFEYNKMMVTYAITAFIAGAWALESMYSREFRIAKTPLDIPILLFVISQLVSTIFSIDPHVSWFGYYSRFNGGMWSIFTYVILYYAFVTHFGHTEDVTRDTKLEFSRPAASGQKTKNHLHIPQDLSAVRNIRTFLTITIATATIVALYGVAEHYGIDKHLWVQDVQSRVFSTLGQPNWLAAFLVALIPVSMVFTLAHPPEIVFGKPGSLFTMIKHAVWSVITLLLFITLIYTRSRSGLAGFAAADIIFWIVIFLFAPKKKHTLPTGIFIHIAFACIIFFNGTNIPQIDTYFSLNGIRNLTSQRTTKIEPPKKETVYTGPLLEVGGTESGTIRKYVWAGAIAAWKSTTKTMLIGTGTETFAFAFYRFRPAAHNMTSEWDFLYNKAHNEYLNYLATTGLFGLAGYLGFLGIFTAWYIGYLRRSNAPKESAKNPESIPLTAGLFAGWISILITNFFGFSVVIMQIYLFLFPACIIALSMDPNHRVLYTFRLRNTSTWISQTVVFVVTGFTVISISLFWYADTLYASGYRDSRTNQFARAKESLETAIRINPGEPNYHDEYASTLGVYAVSAFSQQNATAAAEFAARSLEENYRAIAISPQNVNYWKTRTKLYYSFSTFNPVLNDQAIDALNHALELSPNDAKIYYNLAILYGKKGNTPKAIDLLMKSKSLKPNYHDAYYALYVFYSEDKQPAYATSILQEYLRTVDSKDEQFTKILEGKTP